MRVRTAIGWPLGGAELVDDVKVGTDPPARAFCRQPDEIGFELELRCALAIERQDDRFDGELQPRHPRGQSDGEDDFELRFAPFARGHALLTSDSGRPEQVGERHGRFHLELRRA